jgi:DNA-directed RNA polymerase subunit beta'
VFPAVERDRKRPTDFKAIRIQLASPETIRSWSYGEVTKPETINYRSFKPEKDGLFCERIFGPVKDWECACGKYKRIRYKGVICDRCGVEVTQAKVRRERLGHVELAVPVSHIWFFKGLPSRIGHLLGMSLSDLERILYYESYVVVDAGTSSMGHKELIPEDQYADVMEGEKGSFVAKMGAEGIRDLLMQIDVEDLSVRLRADAKIETSAQKKKDLLKRLKVVEAFRQSRNKPEWMILEVIPVLPPDLRPLVPLEGGRFATSDLNDLYRRVINRNNRLKKLIEIKAPEVILRNEKRMLQEAVDALFDNGRRSRAVRGQGDRPLKSLSDMLKGKQGRFRQNLLGKRVDYSGRSVIVVGPELRLHECGLPKNMALELFKPFIIRKLEDRGYVQTVKSAKKLVEQEKPEVWDILEEIIKDHPVLLNRAPTLHRLGVQGFQPVLVEGKAIRIHPLVCQAFNADFDGDQMAVHVPLSYEAQIEARVLMISSNNILHPANGTPVVTPTQDMVLGCYYLTMPKKGVQGEGTCFFGLDEVRMAYDAKQVALHAQIKVRMPDDGAPGGFRNLETTVGRVLFNEIFPKELGYMNDSLDKKALNTLVGDCYRLLGGQQTVEFLDKLKDMGFRFATAAGITIGIDDLHVPPEKADIIGRAEKQVTQIQQDYADGIITAGERYNRIIDTWTNATNQVSETLFEQLGRDRSGFNPIFMMAFSGSRGSKEQIRQLAGMRGLMAKPQKKITGGIGEIIEMPITANFREGLTVLQYFISTHGARKGLADTALKTADAGYLTRRLVDVAQDVIVTEQDCGTILGLEMTALKEGEDVIEALRDRIVGRTAVHDAVDPVSGRVVVPAGTIIDERVAEEMEELGIEMVRIRSVLTCESRRGVCVACYGRNLATGLPVDIGEAVGVMAAQSIGEPGTQLTLRTFHIGGAAARIAEQTEKVSNYDCRIEAGNVRTVINRNGEQVVLGRKGELALVDGQGRVRTRLSVSQGAILRVRDGQEVRQGDVLFEWDPYTNLVLTDRGGKLHLIDVVEGRTVHEEIDDKTGKREMRIVDDREKQLHPLARIVEESGEVREYILPTGAFLLVADGQTIFPGDVLCKIPKEIAKTRDITGGLPRVAELFEVRRPKDAAVVAEIDGSVSFEGITRGMRKTVVTGAADRREYMVPQGKHMLAHEGEHVTAGDRLTDGPLNPYDILNIKGVSAAQEYLVNEIQEVYRLQGVRINDKHIEVIVRQMLQKVQIEDPGDTKFLEGEQVDKAELKNENERVIAEGGHPASFKPLLLGITKASLSTESFISAASFQETTRVLTEAAIQGKRDELLGLKENVIMGHLIPAGTGISRYRWIRVEDDLAEEEPLEPVVAFRAEEEEDFATPGPVGAEEPVGRPQPSL